MLVCVLAILKLDDDDDSRRLQAQALDIDSNVAPCDTSYSKKMYH